MPIDRVRSTVIIRGVVANGCRRWPARAARLRVVWILFSAVLKKGCRAYGMDLLPVGCGSASSCTVSADRLSWKSKGYLKSFR